MSRYTKDPEAVLDYAWDFTAWLEAGETITSHVVTATPGITVQSSSNTTTTVTAWLAGGTARTRYDVTAHIITSAGRQDDRTIRLFVTNR
jgi:hypothetical protein